MTFIESVKNIHRLSVVIGVIPIIYNKQLKIFETTFYQTAKCIFIITLFTILDLSYTLKNITFNTSVHSNTSYVSSIASLISWMSQAFACLVISIGFIVNRSKYVQILNDLLNIERRINCYQPNTIDYCLLSFNIKINLLIILIDFAWLIYNYILLRDTLEIIAVVENMQFLVEKYVPFLGLAGLDIILSFILIIYRALRKIHINKTENEEISNIFEFEEKLFICVNKFGKSSMITITSTCLLLFIVMTQGSYAFIVDNNATIFLWLFAPISSYIKLLSVCHYCGDEVSFEYNKIFYGTAKLNCMSLLDEKLHKALIEYDA